MKDIVFGFILVVITKIFLINGYRNIEAETKFIFYGPNNDERFVSNSKNDTLSKEVTGCDPAEPYALIVHGWRESCLSQWAIDMRSNLSKYRGGCIICMDYHAYNDDYGLLMLNFPKITLVLLDKLNALKAAGFQSDQAYLFGFSFGARLITSAGVLFGDRELQRGDMCEPAGPGFELTIKNADPKKAFKENQCIHTGRGGYGTREEICLQNWFMGRCGETQLANRPFPNGHHGLCPHFYNSAFTNKFVAVPKKTTCYQRTLPRDAISYSPNMRMGYWQALDPNYDTTEKTFYAITTRDYPFNSDVLSDSENHV